jgi:hypothetical protein
LQEGSVKVKKEPYSFLRTWERLKRVEYGVERGLDFKLNFLPQIAIAI